MLVLFVVASGSVMRALFVTVTDGFDEFGVMEVLLVAGAMLLSRLTMMVVVVMLPALLDAAVLCATLVLLGTPTPCALSSDALLSLLMVVTLQIVAVAKWRLRAWSALIIAAWVWSVWLAWFRILGSRV